MPTVTVRLFAGCCDRYIFQRRQTEQHQGNYSEYHDSAKSPVPSQSLQSSFHCCEQYANDFEIRDVLHHVITTWWLFSRYLPSDATRWPDCADNAQRRSEQRA